MKKIFYSTLLCSFLLAFQCKQANLQGQSAELLLMNKAYLDNTKALVEKNDPKIKAAFDQLIMEAEIALKEGPFSVTDKLKAAPSQDKHDYASYSRYWWPDPEKSDGLPYIRRDGMTNPASQSLDASDRQRIGALGQNTETLGLAYYLTGEEKYAIKAAELLRVWFLNPDSYMNPNVNHAQCRPGHNLGSKSGILDGRLMIMALESSLLIAESTALKEAEMIQLKEWATSYLHWLTNDKMALDESRSRNNHGSFYDVQALYFALYTDNIELAENIAGSFSEGRIESQIKSDGSMPEEMARTRPLFYSIYNLHAMFVVAHLAEKVGVDVWKNTDKDSRLRAGLDFIVPYVDSTKTWPKETVVPVDHMEFFAILQMAEMAYPDGGYLKMVQHLPVGKRTIHRSNLVIPLMR